ncbi:MAG: hypothetical protein H6574_09770 [Lewinellaceae bacterium]|nr:hypothetical protein [Saprospiraceae bacterium]MCB9331358.1 hypothetical protein [Lewinellaceae bacterium]
MTRLNLLMSFLLAGTLLGAQDLHIYYDAFTDSVFYMQNGQVVDQPKARKGSNVMLHVQNYNNYLYNVSVKTQEATVQVGQANPFNLGGLLPGGMPTDLFFGNGNEPGKFTPPTIGIPQMSGAGASAEELQRKALREEMSALQEKFNEAFLEQKQLFTKIETAQNSLQLEVEGQQVQAFVASELQNLRYNPSLEPRQIKKLSQEYMVRIFGEEDPKAINLTTVLEKTDAAGQIKKLQQEYDTNVKAYSETVGVMEVTSVSISDPKFDDPGLKLENFGAFKSTANQYTAVAIANLETFRGNLKEMNTKLTNVKSLDVQTLTDLRLTYLTVMENDFSKTYRQTVGSENLEMSLRFTPIDSTNIKGVSTKQLAPITLSVYGGLRINASLGVGFGQFFDRPLDYYVRDSIIGSTEKDAFNPYLTSFVHFYRQSRSDVSLGGSFGVGIPLGGENGLDNVAFFLGPSLVLGRGQRIVLSAGLLGGKVNKLNGGYEVGDTFARDSSELQTESRYELGYFVGLSFNLVGG